MPIPTKTEDTMNEWEDLEIVDDYYHKMRHTPCGATVLVLMGHVPICPNCEPNEASELFEDSGPARKPLIRIKMDGEV
jgi:hypothetical protein